MLIERPAGLTALADGYAALFEAAVEVFTADERVRGMWLHGAIARGAADAGSDLDISVAVRDADFDEFAGQWQSWLAAITPTLTARPIGPGSCYALTPGCQRLDVIAEPVSKLPASPHTRRIVVFDRGGLTALVPAPADPPPSAATISYLIEETLRQAANFPAVIVRDDWLLGVVAVQQVQLMLYELFAEANKPAPPTGPKQWSTKLTPRQRSVLEALPVPAPNRSSVLAARQAAFAAFFQHAPSIAQRNDVPWPDELDRAVRAYLEREGTRLP